MTPSLDKKLYFYEEKNEHTRFSFHKRIQGFDMVILMKSLCYAKTIEAFSKRHPRDNELDT